MKAGKYYIGDPCYIFDKSWMKILEKTNFFHPEGYFTLFERKCFIGNTAYGDGTYVDNFNRKYAVDAGLLSILPTFLIKIDNKVSRLQIKNSGYMHIVKMEKGFECSVRAGLFKFGPIRIDTREWKYV